MKHRLSSLVLKEQATKDSCKLQTKTQTLTNKTLTAPTLNNAVLSGGSGSIDGVAIGQRDADPNATPAILARSCCW